MLQYLIPSECSTMSYLNLHYVQDIIAITRQAPSMAGKHLPGQASAFQGRQGRQAPSRACKCLARQASAFQGR